MLTQSSSLKFFSYSALTATSISILTAIAFPSQVLSLTTPAADLQSKSLQQNAVSQKSTFLMAKDDDDDHRNNRRGRYDDNDDNDDNDDDDDDRYNNRGRYDDRNDNYRRDEQRYQSSKAFRNQDWSCLLKSGRLANSNQGTLVLQLDILEKPITRYANVVYSVYARQNNRWVQFYSSTGTRLIEQRSGRFSLQPEVIDFNRLRIRNFDLSRAELKFVTQIRYDSASRRDERLVFEDVRNYRDVTEISSIRQLTNINTSNSVTTVPTVYGGQNNNRRRNDNYDDYRRRQEYNRGRYNNSSKAFRMKDWSGLLQFGRLVNSSQRGLVLQLDILEKPITRYANVVYSVYTRRNNRWVQFYSSTGSRLIEQRSGRFSLQPEVIDFNQLRLRNLDLSRSDLKFVTQIRYDSASRRDERLVFEEVRNYREITEISNVREFNNYR